MITVRAEFTGAACSTELHTMALAAVPTGAVAYVVDIHEPGALGERLLELGLTPGTHLQVIRRGLFGDLLQLRLRNYTLTIRRSQAEHIRVCTAVPPPKIAA